MHCHHHPECPGCPLLSHPYAEQLQLKRARLSEALALYPHLPPAPQVRPALHTEGYRHRLKLPVGRGPAGVAIGLYRRDGRTVLNTPDCPVLTPALRHGLAGVHAWSAEHPEVHAVDLRVSDATGELQLILACHEGNLRGGRKALSSLTRAVPRLKSIAVSTADPERKRVMGRRPTLIHGEPWIEEAIGPTRYRIFPGAFFQTDPRTAEALHQLVSTAVGSAATVLDLYAGVGAYALRLAEGRSRVVAVEEVPQAAAAARAMAPPNVEVFSSPVEEYPMNEPFDAVVLNPARRGSDPQTLARVARFGRRLVYVSCGPETLARDLDILAAHGMRVRNLYAIDLFPHTAEVETIAVLEPGQAMRSWSVPGGRAGGPWLGHPSGALGRPEEAVVLVVGDPGPEGRLRGGHYERIAMVASHALLRLYLGGTLEDSLRALANRGHPTAGRDPRTAPFFREKAGLVRPFEHVTCGGRARAPLHGDLLQALINLGAPQALVRALSGNAARSAPLRGPPPRR